MSDLRGVYANHLCLISSIEKVILGCRGRQWTNIVPNIWYMYYVSQNCFVFWYAVCLLHKVQPIVIHLNNDPTVTKNFQHLSHHCLVEDLFILLFLPSLAAIIVDHDKQGWNFNELWSISKFHFFLFLIFPQRIQISLNGS